MTELIWDVFIPPADSTSARLQRAELSRGMKKVSTAWLHPSAVVHSGIGEPALRWNQQSNRRDHQILRKEVRIKFESFDTGEATSPSRHLIRSAHILKPYEHFPAASGLPLFAGGRIHQTRIIRARSKMPRPNSIPTSVAARRVGVEKSDPLLIFHADFPE